MKRFFATILFLFTSASADAQKPKPETIPKAVDKPTTVKSEAPVTDSRKKTDDAIQWWMMSQGIIAAPVAGETKKSLAWEPLMVMEKHGSELSCGPEVMIPTAESIFNAQQMEPRLLKLICASGGTHTISAVFDRRGIVVLGEGPDKTRYVYRVTLDKLYKTQVNGMYVPNSGTDELLGTLEPATATK